MGRALTTAGRRSAVALLAVALAGAAPAPPPIRFEEIGEAAGARLPHHLRQFAGPHADVLEIFTAGGSAVAVADYDGDGDEDLFVTDSDAGRPNRLLRNEWVPSGALRFTEVAAAGGVAGGNDRLSIVADALWFEADGDGRPDLLVARFGTPLLYRNLGGGRFADVTAGSGLETEFGNTIAAIAFDADGDGRLDVLFGHYFKPVNLIELPTPQVLPNNLDEAVNGGGVSLWRNSTEPGTGRPRFVEVSEKAGLAAHTGWTLDVGHADLDDDGDQDLYLAGDYGTDRLYWNRGDGTFEDATKEAIGFDTKKGMNVDVGDYDRDGRLDIYVTNITDDYMRECNMLWHNEGRGSDGRVRFTDVAKETGTCNSLWGWAAKFADFDNDGWEDLFATDGLRSAGPEEYIPLVLELILRPNVDFTDVRLWPAIGDRSWSGFQKKKLFRNLGGGTFKEVAAEAGVDNDRDGRGLGVTDLDDDGLLDFYQTNAGQPALLYRNTSTSPGRWLGLKLAGTGPNPDAIGARVTVRAGSTIWVREVNGGNGYAGQSTTRVHVGLGAVEKVDSVEVRWPGGRVERFAAPLGRYTTVREGEGSAPR
ncbi:MAG TPA: CRTAC1 family protein [Thermoanaerobaculia bacterium]|nr:CRTAC1 family protein [Thermoanaerobaculia bacterium]